MSDVTEILRTESHAERRDRSALEAAMPDSMAMKPELPKPEHPNAFRRVIAFARMVGARRAIAHRRHGGLCATLAVRG